MIPFLIIVFGLCAVSTVMMGRKFSQFYKARGREMCKYVAGLCFYLGATMGVLFWSYIIGLIIVAFTKNFDFLINIAVVGSIISIFPCISGMLRMIGIERRCCSAECKKSLFQCMSSTLESKR